MEAAGGGHVEVTQILLDHGAGTNNQSKDSKIIYFQSFKSFFVLFQKMEIKLMKCIQVKSTFLQK